MSDKMMNDFKELPERIRQIRQNKGLSQENMADELGISTTAYGDLERGKTEITLSRLSLIAAVLETTPAVFLNLQPITGPEMEWLAGENRRLLRENMELIFRNELLEARLKNLSVLTKERKKIGF